MKYSFLNGDYNYKVIDYSRHGKNVELTDTSLFYISANYGEVNDWCSHVDKNQEPFKMVMFYKNNPAMDKESNIQYGLFVGR